MFSKTKTFAVVHGMTQHLNYALMEEAVGLTINVYNLLRTAPMAQFVQQVQLASLSHWTLLGMGMFAFWERILIYVLQQTFIRPVQGLKAVGMSCIGLVI